MLYYSLFKNTFQELQIYARITVLLNMTNKFNKNNNNKIDCFTSSNLEAAACFCKLAREIICLRASFSIFITEKKVVSGKLTK